MVYDEVVSGPKFCHRDLRELIRIEWDNDRMFSRLVFPVGERQSQATANDDQ